MTSIKSKIPQKKSDSSTKNTSNNATKVAWIGFAGVLLAALIAAGVMLFSQSQNKPATVINQSVGNGTTGTVNQAGRDIHNEN